MKPNLGVKGDIPCNRCQQLGSISLFHPWVYVIDHETVKCNGTSVDIPVYIICSPAPIFNGTPRDTNLIE